MCRCVAYFIFHCVLCEHLSPYVQCTIIINVDISHTLKSDVVSVYTYSRQLTKSSIESHSFVSFPNNNLRNIGKSSIRSDSQKFSLWLGKRSFHIKSPISLQLYFTVSNSKILVCIFSNKFICQCSSNIARAQKKWIHTKIPNRTESMRFPKWYTRIEFISDPYAKPYKISYWLLYIHKFTNSQLCTYTILAFTEFLVDKSLWQQLMTTYHNITVKRFSYFAKNSSIRQSHLFRFMFSQFTVFHSIQTFHSFTYYMNVMGFGLAMHLIAFHRWNHFLVFISFDTLSWNSIFHLLPFYMYVNTEDEARNLLTFHTFESWLNMKRNNGNFMWGKSKRLLLPTGSFHFLFPFQNV